MKTVIFGAGNAGQHLLKEMKAHGEQQVDAFLDNFVDTDKAIQGISVYRPDAYLKKNTSDCAIIAAGSQKAIWLMIRKLREYHIENIWMLHEIAGTNHLSLYDANRNFLPTRVRKIHFDDRKPTLPYFEIPIIDDCNLNCKGCLFNCNQHGEKNYMTLDEIVFDFRRMKDLFYDIPWIRILGGEPLLHPQLADVVQTARAIFPDAEIDICTNGLRVPSLPKEVLQTIAENRITMHISEYRPVEKIARKISACLQEFQIEHCFMPRDQFYKFYTQKPVNDAEASHDACPTCGCREVHCGRLVKCSAILAFERMNKQFGTHYETHEGEEWFDLHNMSLTGWDILQKLDGAVSACRYCDMQHKEFFSWTPGTKEQLEDYVLDV